MAGRAFRQGGAEGQARLSRKISIDPGGIVDVQFGLRPASPVVDPGAAGQPDAAIVDAVEQGLAQLAFGGAKGDGLEPGAVVRARAGAKAAARGISGGRCLGALVWPPLLILAFRARDRYRMAGTTGPAPHQRGRARSSWRGTRWRRARRLRQFQDWRCWLINQS